MGALRFQVRLVLDPVTSFFEPLSFQYTKMAQTGKSAREPTIFLKPARAYLDIGKDR